jgi:hypothetical protein
LYLLSPHLSRKLFVFATTSVRSYELNLKNYASTSGKPSVGFQKSFLIGSFLTWALNALIVNAASRVIVAGLKICSSFVLKSYRRKDGVCGSGLHSSFQMLSSSAKNSSPSSWIVTEQTTQFVTLFPA